MTTALQARQAIRSRLEGGGIGLPLRWQNEDKDSTGAVNLPDTPAPFIYAEFLNEGPVSTDGPAAYGGGRGANLWRNRFRIEAYIFVPKGEGLDEADAKAEAIAALFRSHRDATLSCFDATVYPGGDGADLKPPGLSSEVGNYFWACCEVNGHFDQVG